MIKRYKNLASALAESLKKCFGNVARAPEFLRNFALVLHLEEHIRHLLKRHDCVVVPNWGAFITHCSPARYDDVSGCWFPPLRTVVFNPGLSHNDGMLAWSVARRQGISYERALEAVKVEVEAMRTQLAADGEVAVGGVGLFRYGGPSVSPTFHPVPDGVANAPFAFLKPVEAAPAVKSPRVVPDAVVEIASSRRKVVPAFVRIAAAVAVFLTMGFILTLPSGLDGTHTDYASMPGGNPIVKAATFKIDRETPRQLTITTPGADSDAFSVTDTVANKFYRRVVAYNDMRAERRRLRAEAASAPVAAKPAAKAAITAKSDAKGYIIVVASFQSRAKASEFISRAADSRLHISRSGGHFRVYSASAESRAEADSLQAHESRTYPGAWVCGL